MNYSDSKEMDGFLPGPDSNTLRFASFARTLGIISLICAVFGIVYAAFLAGGLAIILAVLSKGHGTSMISIARTGLITGCIAVFVELAVLTVGIYGILYIPEVREYFNTYYEAIYGQSLDESLDSLFYSIEIPYVEGGDL